VLSELPDIHIVDVVLPTESGHEIRNRCVARPTEHQRILLEKPGLRLPERGHLGAGLVFGVQVGFLRDFAVPDSPVGGSLGLLHGAANQVADAVGAGKPQGRTEFSERGACPATTQPSSHVSTWSPASKRRVLRVINSVMRRGRLQHLRDRDSVNAPDRRFVAMAIATLGQSDHPAEKVFAPKLYGDDSGCVTNGFPTTQGFK